MSKQASAGFAVIVAFTVGCAGSNTSAPPAAAPNMQASCPYPEEAIATAVRQRADAEHRARDARQEAERARGEAQLMQHELDDLRSRDTFEDMVWYRVSQAEIDLQAMREWASRAPATRRAKLAEVEKTLDWVEHEARRARSITDANWVRYAHDVESALRDIDRTLRDAR